MTVFTIRFPDGTTEKVDVDDAPNARDALKLAKRYAFGLRCGRVPTEDELHTLESI